MELKHTSIYRILCITLILILSSVSLVFCANDYEYNDVRIYVGNTYQTTIALRSSTVISNGSNVYFELLRNVNTNELDIKMSTGDAIHTGIYVNSINNVFADYRDSSLNVAYVNTHFRVSYTYYDSQVYDVIYLYINTSAVKLATPVLTVSGNTISWNSINNATGYNIQYSADGHQYEYVVTNFHNTSYVCSNSGYYVVQANAPLGTYENSEWSTSVNVVVSSSGNDNTTGGILNWLITEFATVRQWFSNIWAELGEFFQSASEFFNNISTILPQEVRGIIYSVLVVSMIFGVIKHII